MAKWELTPPTDDGLPKSKAKSHSEKKHYYLQRYIHAFTTAMKGKWGGLFYIDLFCGAGIVEFEDGSLTWGSPLIAAQSPVAFDGLLLCERDKKLFGALDKRLARLNLMDKCHLVQGDANVKCQSLIKNIPNNGLCFAFLDPLGLHLHFTTLVSLSHLKCDLLIFFPDRVDLLRNWKLNYWENKDSNPDLVFGADADWRSILASKPKHDVILQITNHYKEQLKTIGYKHSKSIRIHAKKKPLYQLIFFSRHKLGEEIFRGISETDADRQHTFDFG